MFDENPNDDGLFLNCKEYKDNTSKVRAIRRMLLASEPAVYEEHLAALIDSEATIASPINFENKSGSQALMQVLSYWRRAFPNVKSDWLEISEQGSSVTIKWAASASHTGDFCGIEATGKPVAYEGKTTYMFNEQGKLTHYCAEVNIEDIKAQIASPPSSAMLQH